MSRIQSISTFALGFSLVLSATAAVARLPQVEFACQVQTYADKSGLVLVQTDNAELARAAASKAEASVIGGGRSPTLAVIECIDRRSESFRDSTFQTFFLELEL